MAQTDAAQRAEAARLLAQLPGMGVKQDGYSDMDYVLYRLAPLVPALLADAEALAAREAEDAARKERTRAALARLALLSEQLGLYDREVPTDGR